MSSTSRTGWASSPPGSPPGGGSGARARPPGGGHWGGRSLSAGERQLVALVRAWVSNPDLLVLDEATSAVDPALDVSLRRAIDRLISGRTPVTLAHRLPHAEGPRGRLVLSPGRPV